MRVFSSNIIGAPAVVLKGEDDRVLGGDEGAVPDGIDHIL